MPLTVAHTYIAYMAPPPRPPSILGPGRTSSFSFFFWGGGGRGAFFVLTWRHLLWLRTGSGEIDFEEFAELMVKQMKQGSEQEVREAFKAYDTDNKGYFTKDELLKLLNVVSQQSKDIKISKAEIEELVNFLSRNGRVDFDSKWNIVVQFSKVGQLNDATWEIFRKAV